MMSEKLKVAQAGLGPIGNRITRYLLEKEAFEIVAALDLDENKVGRDVGELAGLGPVGIRVTDQVEALRSCGAETLVLTTVSDLERVESQIADATACGMNVVSTCEELSYPWLTHPEIARRIDQQAKAGGVSVLGTGINPGFLMDFLPLALTGVCLDVRRVTIERIQNAAFRRLPFQKKIGAGLPVAEFGRRVEEKTLRHVGLTESMHMIAGCLGWRLDRTEDVVEPVLTRQAMSLGELEIRAGHAIGVDQRGRGYVGDAEVISLVFRATVGETESYDRVQIDGTPQIEMRIENGVNGDIGTGAVTVNAIPVVVKATPGLHTMADLPPVCCFNASAGFREIAG